MCSETLYIGWNWAYTRGNFVHVRGNSADMLGYSVCTRGYSAHSQWNSVYSDGKSAYITRVGLWELGQVFTCPRNYPGPPPLLKTRPMQFWTPGICYHLDTMEARRRVSYNIPRVPCPLLNR